MLPYNSQSTWSNVLTFNSQSNIFTFISQIKVLTVICHSINKFTSRYGHMLQNLHWRSLEDWRKDAWLVIMYNITNEKVAIYKKDRLKTHLRLSWNMHSSSFNILHCKTWQRQQLFISLYDIWLEPAATVQSYQSFIWDIQVCCLLSNKY